jgi:hypothetical protein
VGSNWQREIEDRLYENAPAIATHLDYSANWRPASASPQQPDERQGPEDRSLQIGDRVAPGQQADRSGDRHPHRIVHGAGTGERAGRQIAAVLWSHRAGGCWPPPGRPALASRARPCEDSYGSRR